MLKKKLALVPGHGDGCQFGAVRLWQPPCVGRRLQFWKRVWRNQRSGPEWRLG